MKYSLIIATYNRLPELQELFETLTELEQVKGGFEVVIADDGSTDGTQAFVRSHEGKINIQYLKQENQGPVRLGI